MMVNAQADWSFSMNGVKKNCLRCGCEFFALNKEVNRGKGNCCSVSCANAIRSAKRKIEGARALWISKQKSAPRYIAQRRAHHIVQNEIERGRLIRMPCEICGRTDAIHAHHNDYEKPLDVQWLCVSHHRKHHG